MPKGSICLTDSSYDSSNEGDASVNVSALHRRGIIHKFRERSSNIIIEGVCRIYLNKKAVLTATIGEQVCAIEILNAQDNPFTDHSEMVGFQIVIDKQQLEASPHQLLTLSLFNEKSTQLNVLKCEELLSSAKTEARLDVLNIEEVFPSMGFFGGGKHKPLVVQVNEKVKAIRLVVERHGTFLNFAGLELRGKHGEKIMSGEGVKITASSKMNPAKDLNTVLQDQGFHSGEENNPWLEIKFKTRTFVSSIRIINRKDCWNKRAKYLCVYAFSTKNRVSLLYSRFKHQLGAEQLKLEIPKLLTLSEVRQCEGSGVRVREKMLDRIIESVYTDATLHEQFEILFLKQLLLTWEDSNAIEYESDRELALLALVIFKDTLKSIDYDLRVHARMLSSKERIDQVQSNLNHLRSSIQMPSLQITKHGIAPKGMLTESSDQVIKTLNQVMGELTAMGYKPCLAYGTLLGAYREKQFIEHDDDVDILIELSDQDLSFEEVVELRDQMVARLDSRRYKISYGIASHLNIHLYDIESNVMIDIFPYWYQGDEALLYMEKMAIRGIDRQILSDRKDLEFYGVTFPVPADPEQFLLERYGNSWGVSDRFHEWPWNIV